MKVLARVGDAELRSIRIKGRNNQSRSRTSLPTGFTAAFEPEVPMLAQVLSDTGACFEARGPAELLAPE